MAAAQKGSTAPEGADGFGNEKLSDITTVFVWALIPSRLRQSQEGSFVTPVPSSFQLWIHSISLAWCQDSLQEPVQGTPAGRWGTSTDGGTLTLLQRVAVRDGFFCDTEPHKNPDLLKFTE